MTQEPDGDLGSNESETVFHPALIDKSIKSEGQQGRLSFTFFKLERLHEPN